MDLGNANLEVCSRFKLVQGWSHIKDFPNSAKGLERVGCLGNMNCGMF